MSIFVSRYEVKLDERSRMIVPAPFRSLIEQKGGIIYAYSSYLYHCVEVCIEERLLEVHNMIEQMDVFSPARDAIATAVLSDAERLTLDGKGRIVLPERLLQHAQLQSNAMFAGKGSTFEIWQPQCFSEHFHKSRAYSMSKQLVLKSGGGS